VWYRGKLGFIFFVMLVTVPVVSAFMAVTLHSQITQPDNHANNLSGTVNFTCWLAGSTSEPFIIAAEVNLTDGMDIKEAIEVATITFETAMGNVSYCIRSANVAGDGIWTVEFSWEYVMGECSVDVFPHLGHWFEAVINPSNQTVIYNHCR